MESRQSIVWQWFSQRISFASVRHIFVKCPPLRMSGEWNCPLPDPSSSGEPHWPLTPTVWIDSASTWCIVFSPVLKPLACGRQSRCMGWTYKLPGGQKFSIKLAPLSVGFPQRRPLSLIKRPQFVNFPGVRFFNRPACNFSTAPFLPYINFLHCQLKNIAINLPILSQLPKHAFLLAESSTCTTNMYHDTAPICIAIFSQKY